MATIGFIGLGIMGRPMLRNLLKAGHTVIAYDSFTQALDSSVADGAQRAASSKEVGSRAPIVITMVPDGPQVEEVVLGPDGVLEGAKPGTLIIDMSSINPAVSQKVAAACAAKGVEFLDAPVSGGEPKAIDGTLAIMVGGKEEVFGKAEPLLKSMGSSVLLTGPVGAGNTTKLANQIMVACNIAAMGEALVLATRCGLDPEVVFNAVKGGLAGSTVLNAKAPMVIARNFKPGFKVKLHQKDLRNALQTAEANNVFLPFTALVQQMLNSLIADGKGDLDHSAIATVIEGLSHVEVKRPA
jgi:2-hydroxy-3-oxopropionate reductase